MFYDSQEAKQTQYIVRQNGKNLNSMISFMAGLY